MSTYCMIGTFTDAIFYILRALSNIIYKYFTLLVTILYSGNIQLFVKLLIFVSNYNSELLECITEVI